VATRDSRALLEQARLLADQGRFNEAIELLNKRRAEVSDTDVDLPLAEMLAIVNRVEESLAAYDRVLSRSPDHVRALLGKGHMLRVSGDMPAAQEAYRKCTNDPNAGAEAWWSLLSLSTFSPTDDDQRDLEYRLRHCRNGDPAKILLHFAMARLLERQQSFAAAWQHYCDGNALKRAAVTYDPVETEVRLRKIKTVFSRQFFASEKLSQRSDTSGNQPVPIFIVGMPRSGSTLIEQILASHSRVHGCGELPFVIMMSSVLRGTPPERNAYPEAVESLQAAQFAGLGKTYRYHVREHCSIDRAADCTHFTDKMPANFMHVGFIHSMLPEAKIIDARRHPVATTVANFRQLFAQGKNQGYDLTEFAEYYLQYVAAMDHWSEVLPGRVLRVDYEAVVSDLDAQVRALLEFCELPFEQACIDFHRNDRSVNTASSDQVRRPIYSTSVDSWKHYDPWLDDVKEILADVIAGSSK